MRKRERQGSEADHKGYVCRLQSLGSPSMFWGTSDSIVLEMVFPGCPELPAPPHFGTQGQQNIYKGRGLIFFPFHFIQDLQQSELTRPLKQGGS